MVPRAVRLIAHIAHDKGGANSGEVQKTAQGERKGCTRTWKTNAPRAHRVVHRAHRAYISLKVGGNMEHSVVDHKKGQRPAVFPWLTSGWSLESVLRKKGTRDLGGGNSLDNEVGLERTTGHCEPKLCSLPKHGFRPRRAGEGPHTRGLSRDLSESRTRAVRCYACPTRCPVGIHGWALWGVVIDGSTVQTFEFRGTLIFAQADLNFFMQKFCAYGQNSEM